MCMVIDISKQKIIGNWIYIKNFIMNTSMLLFLKKLKSRIFPMKILAKW